MNPSVEIVIDRGEIILAAAQAGIVTAVTVAIIVAGVRIGWKYALPVIAAGTLLYLL
jgi:hypothetical protein